MSLPKKGSRKISVDGQDYRWSIRSKPTYSEGAFACGMTAAAELYDSPVSTLLIVFDAPRPDNWLLQDGKNITPKMIEASIKASIEDGWKPKEKEGFKFEFKAINNGQF
ncbi:hypothetical protein [Brumicola blandensis]|jgi:hypothetical protein|uniref:Uncharacterized protein n=1 Tax=Brumicola blandensis TaxID=3075611 RepID=A0AAW8R8C5_9ALTE|nr:hypothetical protein [Alteromonas sp. W409]MDT0584361.1 hypothetical protein [Alteromonas sp. W409]